jgi:three-Cys-motif partner protein
MVRKFKKIPEEKLLFENDGLVIPEIGEWSLKKLMLLYIYMEIFNQSMKDKFSNRVFIDLFAGCGCGKIKAQDKIYKGSPLLALSLPIKFTKYILCESNENLFNILNVRVAYFEENKKLFCGDYLTKLDSILYEIPKNSLSLCFVDPFDSEFNFEAIRRLSNNNKMDFIILLATGMDINRNRMDYINPDNKRLDLLLGTDNWRKDWKEKEVEGVKFITFIAEYFSNKMFKLGYLKRENQLVPVRNSKTIIYYLAFFSKETIAYKFWGEAQNYETDQMQLTF